MDGTHYSAILRWKSPAQFSLVAQENPHYFELRPSDTDKLDFTCLFTQEEEGTSLDENVFEASIRAWEKFWNSGAAIDLSESSDPRWKELERRIVLSQYVMRVNEAGSLPPQESGLLNNGWYGRFHFEMIWWHGVHYALWDRWDLLNKSLHVYQDFYRLPVKEPGSRGIKVLAGLSARPVLTGIGLILSMPRYFGSNPILFILQNWITGCIQQLRLWRNGAMSYLKRPISWQTLSITTSRRIVMY